jgi:hypothetical protein
MRGRCRIEVSSLLCWFEVPAILGNHHLRRIVPFHILANPIGIARRHFVFILLPRLVNTVCFVVRIIVPDYHQDPSILQLDHRVRFFKRLIAPAVELYANAYPAAFSVSRSHDVNRTASFFESGFSVFTSGLALPFRGLRWATRIIIDARFRLGITVIL